MSTRRLLLASQTSGGKLITFTMTTNPASPPRPGTSYETTTYTAEEGMTWVDWANSKYNINGFTIYTAIGKVHILHNHGGPVCDKYTSAINAEDLIENNGIYYYE